MPHHVLFSLAEAQAVYQRHCSEQKRAGRQKRPDAWITLSENTLAVVVHDYNAGGAPIRIAYEYGLSFDCAGIHEITARTRNAAGNRKKKMPFRRPEPVREPLKQLHMFKAG